MAVHVLTVLAYKDGDSVTSQFLAGSVNTNPVTIRRLLLELQKARLVETRKGAGFGSRLSRSPKKIDLAEVYRAVEDEEPFIFPVKKPDADCPVGQCIQSMLTQVFTAAEQALERELSCTTLSDIVDRVKRTCKRSHKESV